MTSTFHQAKHDKKRRSTKTATYSIGGTDHEVPVASVCSGIEIQPVYRPDDIADLDYDRDLGEPGQFPYTRGIYPTMHRTHLWTFRNYAGFGTAAASNERFRKLIDVGQMGLSIAFDLPTQLGMDSDSPEASHEVGRVGVHIDTLADMEILFDRIDIAKVSTSFTINATAPIIMAMYLALAENRGVKWSDLRGTMQNDPLKEFVARGNFIFPPKPAVRLAGDIMEFATANCGKFYPISFSASHIKEAGANNAYAIAACFSNALAYVDDLISRGYSIDEFGPTLSFNINGDMEFFENICQMRAARRLWAHIMRDRYGATEPKAMQMRYYVGAGSGSSLTYSYPLLNIARVAYFCMAQALGGTQAVGLQGYDEAYDIPSEEAAQLALLTQAVVAYESGVPDVVDPLAGSYFVESLTNEIEDRIRQYMQGIEDAGGAIEAVEAGIMQRDIARQSYEWQRRVESGEQVVVGVNMFVPDESEREEPRVFEYDAQLVEEQRANLEQVRGSRDDEAVARSLADLRACAERGDNVMQSLIQASRAYATVGEMTQVLREVFGLFEEPAF